VITEIHVDPAGVYDAQGEWFELLNTTTDRTFTLAGATFSDDDGESFTVADGVTVGPGELVVLGRSGETIVNGGAMVNYGYGTTMNLANGGDEIVLTVGGVVIDRVAWTGSWPVTRGASMQLDPSVRTHDGNDAASVWCASAQEFGTAADRGSPGRPNASCGL
jgi:hypothetical protein